MNAAQRSSRTVSMAGFELTARDAVIGQSGTLTVVKPGNGYTFRFSYNFGEASGTLESGEIRQVSHAAGRAVYRWRVPEELAQQIPVAGHALDAPPIGAPVAAAVVRRAWGGRLPRLGRFLHFTLILAVCKIQ